MNSKFHELPWAAVQSETSWANQLQYEVVVVVDQAHLVVCCSGNIAVPHGATHGVSQGDNKPCWISKEMARLQQEAKLEKRNAWIF